MALPRLLRERQDFQHFVLPEVIGAHAWGLGRPEMGTDERMSHTHFQATLRPLVVFNCRMRVSSGSNLLKSFASIPSIRLDSPGTCSQELGSGTDMLMVRRGKKWPAWKTGILGAKVGRLGLPVLVYLGLGGLSKVGRDHVLQSG